jgi:peptidoglycan/LPS O-acetylase OafA/YrhL
LPPEITVEKTTQETPVPVGLKSSKLIAPGWQTSKAYMADASDRKDIDGLCAIAVTEVVLFHAFPGILPGGFTCVDVFFVISGYLISGIIFDEIAQDALLRGAHRLGFRSS